MTYTPMTPPSQGDLIPPSYIAQLIDNDQYLRANMGILNAIAFAELAGSGVFSLTGLSQDYDTLILHMLLKPSGNNLGLLRFNNDSGNNYGAQRFAKSYSTSDATETVSTSAINFYANNSTGNPWVFYEIKLPSYTKALPKLVDGFGSYVHGIASQEQRRLGVHGQWNVNDPISRIDIAPASGTYEAKSWVAVYGSKHL